MSLKRVPLFTRSGGVCAALVNPQNRLLINCPRNNFRRQYARLVCNFPLANQSWAQKFNRLRLGHDWVFPPTYVHSINIQNNSTPFGKLRYFVTSASMNSFQTAKSMTDSVL